MREMRELKEKLKLGKWKEARLLFRKFVKWLPQGKRTEALIELLSSVLDVTGGIEVPPKWKLHARQSAIPKLAKDKKLLAKVQDIVQRTPTKHVLALGDSRCLVKVPDSSVHLIVTSPPYWNLKEYPARLGQLGIMNDFQKFRAELSKVWEHCFRILVPGGRLVIVVGDVCLSRRLHGRHRVEPLHAALQMDCRAIGFDNLAPIIWYKIANAQYEVKNGSTFLGKPYEPNAVIKNDIEFILMQRKPGGYRTPSMEKRLLSVIPADEHKTWFNQVWDVRGASTREHPAPYPPEIPERLIRMFSFVGDTILDPFAGTGTTFLGAARHGRHSIGIEIEPNYLELIKKRLLKETTLFSNHSVVFDESGTLDAIYAVVEPQREHQASKA